MYIKLLIPYKCPCKTHFNTVCGIKVRQSTIVCLIVVDGFRGHLNYDAIQCVEGEGRDKK